MTSCIVGSYPTNQNWVINPSPPVAVVINPGFASQLARFHAWDVSRPHKHSVYMLTSASPIRGRTWIAIPSAGKIGVRFECRYLL